MNGSRTLTPKSRLLSTRETAYAPTLPNTTPASASTSPRRTTMADHALRARAERDADADLTRPLLYRVGDHAVDAHHREHDRERGEDREQE